MSEWGSWCREVHPRTTALDKSHSFSDGGPESESLGSRSPTFPSDFQGQPRKSSSAGNYSSRRFVL